MSRLHSVAFIDRMGVLASGTCAVHCAACVLLPGALAALGVGALFDSTTEWVFCALAVTLAGLSLVRARRLLRSPAVTGTFGLGIGGLLGARWLEAVEHPLGVVPFGLFAGVLLVGAHVVSARALRRCNDGCPVEAPAPRLHTQESAPR